MKDYSACLQAEEKFYVSRDLDLRSLSSMGEYKYLRSQIKDLKIV
ncbi:MAG: hypothetical protein QXX47_02880 [Sulfolobales archaeon]